MLQLGYSSGDFLLKLFPLKQSLMRILQIHHLFMPFTQFHSCKSYSFLVPPLSPMSQLLCSLMFSDGQWPRVASLPMVHWGTCPPRVLEILCILQLLPA